MDQGNSDSRATVVVTRRGPDLLRVAVRLVTGDGLKGDAWLEVRKGMPDYEYYLEKLAK